MIPNRSRPAEPTCAESAHLSQQTKASLLGDLLG